jgi:hypothetical protein
MPLHLHAGNAESFAPEKSAGCRNTLHTIEVIKPDLLNIYRA